jgi:CRP-like cAMP-binding protein
VSCGPGECSGGSGPGDVLFPNTLFPPTPAASYAALISDGIVKVTANWPDDDREILLSIHGQGDLIGEEGALRAAAKAGPRMVGRDRRVVATALTEVTAPSEWCPMRAATSSCMTLRA